MIYIQNDNIEYRADIKHSIEDCLKQFIERFEDGNHMYIDNVVEELLEHGETMYYSNDNLELEITLDNVERTNNLDGLIQLSFEEFNAK